MVITLSNKTSSATLLDIFVSLGRGCGLSVCTTRVGRGVHNSRTGHSRGFYGVLYGGFGARLFVGDISIPALTGRRGVDRRLYKEGIHCTFFRRLSRGLYTGVTATRATSSGTRALVFGVTENTSLTNLSTVPPGQKGVVEPLVRLSENSVRDCYRRGGLRCIASDAGLTSSCAQGCVERGVVPYLGGLGPSFRQATLNLDRGTKRSTSFVGGYTRGTIRSYGDSFNCSYGGLLDLSSTILGRVLFVLLGGGYGVSPREGAVLLLYRVVKGKKDIRLSGRYATISGRKVLHFMYPGGSPSFGRVPLGGGVAFSCSKGVCAMGRVARGMAGRGGLISGGQLNRGPIFHAHETNSEFACPSHVIAGPLHGIFGRRGVPSRVESELLLLTMSGAIL